MSASEDPAAHGGRRECDQGAEQRTVEDHARTPQLSPPYDVAIVLDSLQRGGAERVSAWLTHRWVEQGIRSCIITLADEDEEDFPIHPEVGRIALGVTGVSESLFAGALANLRRARVLREALRTSMASRVLSLVVETNVLTVLATRGLGIHLVVSERNDPTREPLRRPWMFLRRWTYRYADAVTAISPGSVDELARYVPRDRLQVIPVVPSRDHDLDGVVELDRPVVLAVGRLVPQKGHDLLIRAFASLHPYFPDWELIIVGEGSAADGLRALAAQLGLRDHVRLVGRVSDPFPYYRAAEVFAFPSRYEGVGNALLEAMLCGLPVVVSDASPGPLDYVRDGETGLVVPSEDVEELAAALHRLMDSSELRRRLGHAARQRVEQASPDQVVASWTDVLHLTSVGKGASLQRDVGDR